jgi:hypothetical protein
MELVKIRMPNIPPMYRAPGARLITMILLSSVFCAMLPGAVPVSAQAVAQPAYLQ